MKIETEADLRELYGYANKITDDKVLAELEKHAINFIEKSPFLVLSTVNKAHKLDTSPRGGQPGFVKVLDTKTIVIPDFKGNNKVDSLSNIIQVNRVGLLFMIPGVDETLRLNGSAFISTEKLYLDVFSTETKKPKSCIVVNIHSLFLHCALAFMRSGLWNESSKINRQDLPTMGQMLKDQLGSAEAPESQEDMLKRYTPIL